MLKKILLAFMILFLAAGVTFALTLEQEKNLVEYIAQDIDEYVHTVNWNEVRMYQKEADEIGKIIQGYEYSRKEYAVSIFASKETRKPVAVGVIIKGRANPKVKPFWKLMWLIENVPQKNPPGQPV